MCVSRFHTEYDVLDTPALVRIIIKRLRILHFHFHFHLIKQRGPMFYLKNKNTERIQMRSTSKIRFRPILLCFFLWVGCSDSKNTDATNTDTPDPIGEISPVLDSTLKVSKSFDTAGGNLELTSVTGIKMSLTLPEGAVGASTEISMTPINEIENLSFVENWIGGVQFEPDGLLLLKPATLTIALPAGTDLSKLVNFAWDGSGTNVHMELVSEASHVITFSVNHFSGVAAATGDATSAATAMSNTSTLEAKYKNIMLLEVNQLNISLCGGYCNEIDEVVAFSEAFDAMVITHTTLWLDELKPITADAELNDAAYDAAKFEFFMWQYTTDFLLCGATPLCEIFKNAYSDTAVDVLELDIARGMIARFGRAFEAKNDKFVSDLIAEAIALGENFTEHFLSLLAQPEGTSLDYEFRQRYASQLVIVVSNFPNQLVLGGEVVDF
jgi:hypothetical protein